MEQKKRTYGFLVETEIRYGTTYVTAKVLAREGEADHPINCKSDGGGEDSYWDAPKHLHGCYLAGLELGGHIYEHSGQKEFNGFYAQFRDVYLVDERAVAGMARTFKKIRREFSREGGSLRDPGDIYMAVAKALKLDWSVHRGKRHHAGSGYDATNWIWWPVAEGRNELRQQIREAEKVEEAA